MGESRGDENRAVEEQMVADLAKVKCRSDSEETCRRASVSYMADREQRAKGHEGKRSVAFRTYGTATPRTALLLPPQPCTSALSCSACAAVWPIMAVQDMTEAIRSQRRLLQLDKTVALARAALDASISRMTRRSSSSSSRSTIHDNSGPSWRSLQRASLSPLCGLGWLMQNVCRECGEAAVVGSAKSEDDHRIQATTV